MKTYRKAFKKLYGTLPNSTVADAEQKKRSKGELSNDGQVS